MKPRNITILCMFGFALIVGLGMLAARKYNRDHPAPESLSSGTELTTDYVGWAPTDNTLTFSVGEMIVTDDGSEIATEKQIQEMRLEVIETNRRAAEMFGRLLDTLETFQAALDAQSELNHAVAAELAKLKASQQSP